MSSHPQIAIAPETHYCNRFIQHTYTKGPLDLSIFRSFWSTFSESERFKELGVNATVIEHNVYESGDLSLSNTFKLVLREYARLQGRARWGEKTPHHYMYIRLLLQWFPEARILVMVRDPRAVCNSLLVVPWRKWDWRGVGSLEPRSLKRMRRLYLDAVQWQRHVDDLRLRWSEDPRIRIVTYESLVQKPDVVVRQVCEFVEEDFVESMLGDRSQSTVSRDYSSYSHGADPWTRNHLASTIAPVTTAPVEKWKNTLFNWEVQCIEQACASGMQWLEYQKHDVEMTLAEKITAHVGALWSSTYRRLSLEGRSSRTQSLVRTLMTSLQVTG